MERSQLMRGVLDVAVLAVISERDAYGYEIQRRLIDAGLDGLGEATIYGTLRRLYKSGALSAYAVPSDEGPNRRYYSVTNLGRDQLAHGRSEWSAFVDTLTPLLDPSPLSAVPVTTTSTEEAVS